MRIRIRTMASGSEGNALLAEFGDHRILIDAGISGKVFQEMLAAEEIGPESIRALLLTHEHIDHCKGLLQILKKTAMPVYASRGTFEGLSRHSFFERLPKEHFQLFKAGEGFELGPLRIRSLPISHDAQEPVAYRIEAGEYAFACVTDLGCFDEALVEGLMGLDSLLLEANHNRRILETGPYPYALKLRIDSDRGHLSNEAAGELLGRIFHPGLTQVMLGHLSSTNNYPPLARDTVTAALAELGSVASRVNLLLAPPKGYSQAMGRGDED